MDTNKAIVDTKLRLAIITCTDTAVLSRLLSVKTRRWRRHRREYFREMAGEIERGAMSKGSGS